MMLLYYSFRARALLSGFLVFLLLCACNPVSARAPMCIALNLLDGINYNLFSYTDSTYTNSSLYFCAKNSPLQYHCSCPLLYRCAKKPDPWGRDIGYCTCCAWYIIMLFTIIGILAALSVLMLLYFLLCSNKWWFDGFPLPLKIKIPRRGPIVPCPPGPVFPSNLFQGYRPSQFSDVTPTEQPPREGISPLFRQTERNENQRPVFELLQQESLSR